MNSVMQIGAKVDKEDVNNLAEGIERIFNSGFENHMDQNTIIQALNIFSRTFEVKNVTVTNSKFVGEDKTVTVNTGKDDSEQSFS